MRLKFKNPPHHCADIALVRTSAKGELKRLRFDTKNLARRETGCYLAVVQMLWLIAQRRQESIVSPVLIDRGDQPNTGPRVRDGLIQMPIAMKQLC